MFEVWIKAGMILIVPTIILLSSIFLRLAAGPFWLATNFDPSYQYLVNGVYLIKGFVPNLTGHPGTPLQILFFCACWLCNIGQSVENVVIHVFTTPEFYLQVVFVILTAGTFLTSILLAAYIYQKTNDGLAAVLSQLPALSFLVLKSWETAEPCLPIVANVYPETMMISAVNLFNVCLLMDFFEENWVSTILLAIACGFAVAIKITFLPILVIPLLILSLRNKAFFVCIFVASFVLFTLPIISKYNVTFGWISGIATHSLGSSVKTKGFDTYFSNLTGIFLQFKVFAISLFLSLACIFWKLWVKKGDRGTFFLGATTIGIFFQFSSVTQYPGEHYLSPGIGLFSSLWVLLYFQSVSGRILGRRIIAVLIVITVLMGTCKAMDYRTKLAGFTNDILTFYNHVHTKYKGYAFLGFYRSSGQSTALAFGDWYTGDPKFRNELFQIYPDSYFFDRWGTYRIADFHDRVLSNDILAHSTGILFEGDSTDPKFDLIQYLADSPFSAFLLERGRLESIYLLTNTTEKQSLMCFEVAAHFAQEGNLPKALDYAVQAKALHYQPQSSVDEFINFISPYVKP